MPDSTIMGSGDKRDRIRRVLRITVIVLSVAIVLLIAFAIALGILSNTGAFSVSRIETFDSEHITAEEVARLSNVSDDVTLLNVDVDAIQNGVRRNPWVASVDVERVFPDTLRLHVNERALGAVVAMRSGGVAWTLGNDNVWIEPLKLEVQDNESSSDAALAKASSLGVILISDAPDDVMPAAGAECTDPSIQAVMSIASQLSAGFKEKIVCYSASTPDDISFILNNGIEISFGSDSDISTKEAVALRMIEEYGGQIVYINVRTPARPSYRRVDSEYVREGTGATGTAVEESVVPKVRALEDEESADSQSDKNEQGQEGQTAKDGQNNSQNSGQNSGQNNGTSADNDGYGYGGSANTTSTYEDAQSGNSQYDYSNVSGGNGAYSGYEDYSYDYSGYGYDDYYSSY